MEQPPENDRLITVDTKYGTLEGSYEVVYGSTSRIILAPPERYVLEHGNCGSFKVWIAGRGDLAVFRYGQMERAEFEEMRRQDRNDGRYAHLALTFAEGKAKWLERKYPEWKRSVSLLERTGVEEGKMLPYRGRLIRIACHEERIVTLRGFDEAEVGRDAPSVYTEAEGATLYLPSPAQRSSRRVLVGGREMKLKSYAPKEAEICENRDMIRAWYAVQAMRVLRPKTLEFARCMGADLGHIGWTWAQTLWGKNKLDVRGGRRDGYYRSLEIVYHPLSSALSDYELDALVWHELAHCKETNHQKAFYEELCRWVPDYKARDKALKAAGWVKSFPLPVLPSS